MRTDTRCPASRAPQAPTVLVVESDASSASLLGDALERGALRVLVERRAEQVIQAVERDAVFDALVVGRDLDAMDRLDLVTYLRHRFPATPIIFIADAGTDLLALAALDRGATRCLQEQVAVNQVVGVVRDAIDAAQGARIDRAIGRDGRPRSASRPRDVLRRGPAGRLWGVILALGETFPARSRSLPTRPFAPVAPVISAERMVLIGVRSRGRGLDPRGSGSPAPTVLLQPADRGTLAGILLPALWIRRRDPGATVAIFPRNHRLASEPGFMAHVADVAAFIDAYPQRIVLVGAPATGVGADGWVEPAECLGRAGSVSVWSVERFVETRSPEAARGGNGVPALWRTCGVVARASVLADAGHQFAPDVYRKLQDALAFVATGWEIAALRRTYAALTHASFSTAVLERCAAPLLAVSRFSGATWRTSTSPAWRSPTPRGATAA